MLLRPDQFTEQAQEVLAASQEIAGRYRHNQWDSEHILMAILEQDKGVPADILRELGVSLEVLRGRLHQFLEKAPRSAQGASQMYITPCEHSYSVLSDASHVPLTDERDEQLDAHFAC